MATFDPKAPNPNANGSNRDGGSGYDDVAFRDEEDQHVNNPSQGDQEYRRVYDATYSGVVRQSGKSGK